MLELKTRPNLFDFVMSAIRCVCVLSRSTLFATVACMLLWPMGAALFTPRHDTMPELACFARALAKTAEIYHIENNLQIFRFKVIPELALRTAHW